MIKAYIDGDRRRQCYTCKETKKLDSFYRNKREPKGRSYQCKKCHNSKKYYYNKISRLIRKRHIKTKANPYLLLILKKIRTDIKQNRRLLKNKGMRECKECGMIGLSFLFVKRKKTQKEMSGKGNGKFFFGWLCVKCRPPVYNYKKQTYSEKKIKAEVSLDNRRKRHRKRGQKASKEKTDWYLKKLLKDQFEIKLKDIPASLIELKRMQLTMARTNSLLKRRRKENEYSNHGNV